tara:strand:- start:1238 stop:1381 length:144 start_codon:yes stop_codon:yes gene_type:complete
MNLFQQNVDQIVLVEACIDAIFKAKSPFISIEEMFEFNKIYIKSVKK